MNGPFRESRPGGHVEPVDVAVVRQDKESLAIAGPGEGVVSAQANFDWELDAETAVLTVVDTDRVTSPTLQWRLGVHLVKT